VELLAHEREDFPSTLSLAAHT